MAIENTWEEVVDTAEDVLIYIFRGIRERSKYWMDVVQRTYPDAGNFKIPDGRAPRLRFAEGIKMLKDAGIEASEDEDIRYAALSTTYVHSDPLFAAPQTKRHLDASSSKNITRISTS